jgi:hypothetical protein
MRHLLPLLLSVGCAAHAPELAHPAKPSFGAWVWQGEAHDETFLLTATERVAVELAELAPETGYAVRPATADDFRESWPVLKAYERPGPTGQPEVTYDLGAADHVALTNLWVELMVIRESQRASLNPSAERYVRSAVHSTRP